MTVGSYDAKTHFSSLLERVARGEEITITRHGTPVAKIVPVTSAAQTTDRKAIVAAIRELRKGSRLRGLSIRKLMNEGRR